MSTTLHELVYSNAPGSDGVGFRVVRRPGEWAADDSRVAESWVRDLRPIADGVEASGFAASGFRIGRSLYAAVARVSGGFARDTHGRAGGVLTHLLAVPVAEEHDIALHASALVAEALRLKWPEVPDHRRLASYLAAIQDRRIDELRPPSLAALRVIDADGLRHFLRLAAAAPVVGRPQTPEVTLDIPAGRQLPEVLAALSGALPPRLRLALRWGCGLRPGAHLHLLGRLHPAPAAASSRANAGDMYWQWLRARLERDERRTLCQLLSSWEIQSWDDLLDEIGE